ncbi:MAG: family 43 glycosylhydrolase [Lentisphaerae bacterium]|nr:family 43 glycosylhydrolase [Lentisphaerota bacterium]
MKDFETVREHNLAVEYPALPPTDQFLDPDHSKETWMAEHERYRHPPGDSLREGFAPTGMTTTDFTVIRHDGVFHLYGAGGYPGCFTNWQGQYEYIYHASSPDLIDWTVHGKALTPHPDHHYENNKVWPPFVFKQGGRFVMVYCGLDYDNCQCLCLAFSDDLFAWTRFPDNPIVNPGQLDWTLKRPDGKVRHCRDPHVEEVDGVHYLYYATVCGDGNPGVGLAASVDLSEWIDLGPCLKRTDGWVPESPLVIPRDGKYYLMVLPNEACYVSDSPETFHNATTIPVSGPRVVAPEILDRRFHDRYLIGCYGPQGCRISVCIMEWREGQIDISPVTDAKQLEPWREAGALGST